MSALRIVLRPCLLLLAALPALSAASRGPVSLASYGKVPLSFERNEGQASAGIDFLASGPGYTIGLSGAGSTLVLGHGRINVKTTLLGARHGSQAVGEEPLSGKVHRLTGGSPEAWRTGIPTFGRVRFREVYPRIDAVYYGNRQELEYDFEVAPGADPTQIRMSFAGVRDINIAHNGDLVLQLDSGELRHHKPRAFQRLHGNVKPVKARYRIPRPREVVIDVGEYDRTQPLIIDPVLTYSTYLGGAGDDRAYGIAVDSAGCAYIVGETFSTNFPVANAQQASPRGYSDVFVTKLNAAGTAVVFSTYLGGADRDAGHAIALDASGFIYVAGYTRSTNFPATYGVFRRSNAGGEDAFVAKLDPGGAYLAYSTYVGGSGSDRAQAIAVDPSGNAYLAGYTASVNFPLVNALQSAFGGAVDAFVAKLDSSGTRLVYSTYLGGTDNDTAAGIAVDSSGSAYVAGQTQSTNFPARNALQPAKARNGDAFVARLTPDGAGMAFATYLGGSGADAAQAIAVDPGGSLYIAGSTYSIDFPTTNGVRQRQNAGGYDAFVSRISASGNVLMSSTLLGGANADQATAIAVGKSGDVHIGGYTASADFPSATPTGFQFSGASDGFLAVLDGTLTTLRFSTYLGSNGDDSVRALALGSDGSMFVAGQTQSPSFPVTSGVFGSAFYGAVDAFSSRLESPSPRPSAVSADFDGNGVPDLVWQNEVSRMAGVWFMGGSGGTDLLDIGYPAPGTYPGWALVSVADFNRDGCADLVWQHDNTRQVRVWYMTGPKCTDYLGESYPAPGSYPGWKLVSVADLDRNGVPDLVWQHEPTRMVGAWYMGGAQATNILGIGYPAPGSYPGWRLAGIADMDRNGVPDLVWQNDATRMVRVWYMDGSQGTVLLGLDYPAPGAYPGWTVIAIHDVDGNSCPDLVWQDDSTRQVGVWHMGGPNGTALLAVGYPAPGSYPGWRAVGPR